MGVPAEQQQCILTQAVAFHQILILVGRVSIYHLARLEGMGFDGFCSASEWHRISYCKLTHGTSVKNTPLPLEGFLLFAAQGIRFNFDRSSRPRRLSPHLCCQLGSLNPRLSPRATSALMCVWAKHYPLDGSVPYWTLSQP